MNNLERLELRFQGIVTKADTNNYKGMDKDLNRIAIALNDLKNNCCGCGETMRIKIVEDLINHVEERLANK